VQRDRKKEKTNQRDRYLKQVRGEGEEVHENNV
jgi:hypothetical protein